MITPHPFSNGNATMSTAWSICAIKRRGFPFTIPLTSRHRKSRNHNMMAILQAKQTYPNDSS